MSIKCLCFTVLQMFVMLCVMFLKYREMLRVNGKIRKKINGEDLVYPKVHINEGCF